MHILYSKVYSTPCEQYHLDSDVTFYHWKLCKINDRLGPNKMIENIFPFRELLFS